MFHENLPNKQEDVEKASIFPSMMAKVYSKFQMNLFNQI